MNIEEPLANYFRPKNFDEIVGQEHLFNKENKIFYKAINNTDIVNMIFYGPPGVGKTTIAEIIARKSNRKIFKLNCTLVKTIDIRIKMKKFYYILMKFNILIGNNNK